MADSVQADSGQWTVGSGQRTADSGQRIVGVRQGRPASPGPGLFAGIGMGTAVCAAGVPRRRLPTPSQRRPAGRPRLRGDAPGPRGPGFRDRSDLWVCVAGQAEAAGGCRAQNSVKHRPWKSDAGCPGLLAKPRVRRRAGGAACRRRACRARQRGWRSAKGRAPSTPRVAQSGPPPRGPVSAIDLIAARAQPSSAEGLFVLKKRAGRLP